MGFIRFVLGLVAFAIAVKLVAILLGIMKLLGIVVVLGVFVLVAWLIYKMISPRSTQQA